jgi:GDP-D-mannose dehydratase
MWRMLQQDEPEDFVLATGETHPVREYVDKAFGVVGMTLKCVHTLTYTRPLKQKLILIASQLAW